MNRYAWLVAAAAGATYLLIVIGGIVRVSGAGLGCPDWPLCHGMVVPPPKPDAWVEFSHRVAAAAMAVISLAALVGAYVPRRRPAAPWLTAGALVLVGQILLGGFVVLAELPGLAVNLHLLFALIILALILMALVASLPAQWRPATVDPGLRRLALGATVAVFLLIVSGSYVFGSGTSLACAGWPLCENGPLPGRLSDWINFSHRLVAALVGGVVLWLCWRAWQQRAVAPALGWLAAVLGGLLLLQMAVGALVVLLRLNGPWPALHLVVAGALWATQVILTALVSQPRVAPVVTPAPTPAELGATS
ncbi:MAG: COX15/CtaA family protein [Chloroflexi bacterium]|nr:COX15/CtaA family protein [Chloroflexota bacterium]GIW10345.1 MAG: cytochrome oxidase assembly protein [Dehalococcoidia bacterium]